MQQRRWCVVKPGTGGATARITACLSRRYCGWPVRVARGETCRRSSAHGTAFMSALPAGPTSRYGRIFSRCCARMPTSRRSISTAPLCVPISMRPVPRKKGEQALGRSRGGLSTKIHACVEGLGQLARFILTAGQVHDVTQAQALLETVVPAAVLADKAYDANALLACIANKQAKAVIPPKATRKVQRQFDRHQYRNRNVIERFLPGSNSSAASPLTTTNSRLVLLLSSH